MKKGSFDNYLLTTKPQIIDSRFGLHLRSLMKQKLKDPTMKLDYIPGTSTVKKAQMGKKWHLKRMPAVYTPAHIRATRDLSQFYEKPPSEMSRYEL